VEGGGKSVCGKSKNCGAAHSIETRKRLWEIEVSPAVRIMSRNAGKEIGKFLFSHSSHSPRGIAKMPWFDCSFLSKTARLIVCILNTAHNTSCSPGITVPYISGSSDVWFYAQINAKIG
jgi:hypothetical protein